MKPLALSLFVAASVLLIPQFIQAQSPANIDKAIETYLLSEKGQETLGKSMESLMKKRQGEAQRKQEEQMASELENAIKNPSVIPVGTSAVKGPANAKITIVEFSDFECPFCTRGMQTMDEVLKLYPNDVKLVFKHFPLEMHAQAKPASKAAIAAGKQGKFWEMHDALFANQRNLNDKFYEEAAQKLGLNLAQFKKDFADPENDKIIADDMALGQKNGIQGTPGFFVNGVPVRGAYPVPYFKNLIDRLLASKDAPAAKPAA